jgi:hypothetical protein
MLELVALVGTEITEPELTLRAGPASAGSTRSRVKQFGFPVPESPCDEGMASSGIIMGGAFKLAVLEHLEGPS